MAKTTQRAFALTLAILFFVTTVGFSGYFIWEMTQGTDQAEDPAAQTAEESQTNEPKEYMQDFEPLGDERVAELKTTDKTVGTGTEAKETSTVRVEYTGALAKDGSIFDSSAKSGGGEPAEFSLDQVIAGFKDGIVGMKEGGERRIFIPAAQAYKDQSPTPAIPADSDLVFDVKLVEVK